MEQLDNKLTGDTLSAAEWNQVPAEIQNLITAFGIALSSGDLNQMRKALADFAGVEISLQTVEQLTHMYCPRLQLTNLLQLIEQEWKFVIVLRTLLVLPL